MRYIPVALAFKSMALGIEEGSRLIPPLMSFKDRPRRLPVVFTAKITD
jgi:hypothetical protein